MHSIMEDISERGEEELYNDEETLDTAITLFDSCHRDITTFDLIVAPFADI
jgi:hypothetical protein